MVSLALGDTFCQYAYSLFSKHWCNHPQVGNPTRVLPMPLGTQTDLVDHKVHKYQTKHGKHCDYQESLENW